MGNIFESIKTAMTDYNTFDLSEDVKLSMKQGFLYPTYNSDTLPGDHWRITQTSLVRVAPMVAPIMHRIDQKNYNYFTPARILWPNWKNWIANIKVAGAVPAHPYISVDTNWVEGCLLDYLGYPPPDPTGITGNSYLADAFPLAVYQRIWFEEFRDQNLITGITEADITLVDGNNSGNANLFILRKKAWEHDYFTSCLPVAQKGDPVQLPLGQFADVPVKIDETLWEDVNLTNTLNIPPNPSTVFVEADTIIGATPLPDNLYAKTSLLVAQAATINALRLAYRLQTWLETAERAGSRLIEVIEGHFNVKSSDQRLQRPEFINGNQTPVIISEVLNTSDTASAPQGNMSGHGVAVAQGISSGYRCEEWGWIMTLTCILPKTCYSQGLHRRYSKFQDYTKKFWPEFDGLGEQEVLNQEIYVDQPSKAETFGYLPHWQEYKTGTNRVAGSFRTSLDFWHWARKFATPPALNQAFIEVDSVDNRIFAVTADIDHFWAHILHEISCGRKMGKYGTPGRI